MSSQTEDSDPVVWTDGRQSPTAAGIQRGVGRMLRDAGFSSLFELALANGRRADVIAVGPKGQIWIVEIKSSPADYKSDSKWHEYMEYCDRYYFAIPPDMDAGLIDQRAGLIVADAWGAEVLREADEAPLVAARRKAVTLLIARTSTARLQAVNDPKLGGLI